MGKCVPQFIETIADDLDSLWLTRGTAALRCEVLAAMVYTSLNPSAKSPFGLVLNGEDGMVCCHTTTLLLSASI